MKIFFNADDVGVSRSNSSRSLQAWNAGLIDGMSFLANGDATEETLRASKGKRNRPLRISVHLNLTEGRSILNPAKLPLLVDEKGFFKHTIGSLLWLYMTASKRKRNKIIAQVSWEWEAQIHRVSELCFPRKIGQLDGHQHVHMLPFLFPVGVILCTKFGIRKIRIVKEPIYLKGGFSGVCSEYLKNILKVFVLRILARTNQLVANKQSIGCSDATLGVLYCGAMDRQSVSVGISAAKKRRIRSLEILIHLGQSSKAEVEHWNPRGLFGKFHCSADREKEYQELLNLKKFPEKFL